MSILKNKFFQIPALIVLVVAIVIFVKIGLVNDNTYTAESGLFEVSLNIKGEIQGKNAVVISIPDELKNRELRIWGLKIQDMVAEGTIVKKGDWVATLDAATITQQMQDNSQDLAQRRAELNDAKIDSAIQLTKLREELDEFTYDLEYKKLELEQARFESPAFQRKKEVEFNRTVRQMDKKGRDLELKALDLKTRTKRIQDRYDYHARRDSLLKQALAACRVKAPKAGMVMYAKMWGGRKLRIGDEVGMFNSSIATLPDLSVLVSETYVPEIDITKISVGDSVEILIDALPNKIYSGFIYRIANMGQELPGYDTKVFRVLIEINENGEELKPSMTTDNRIILARMENVVKIPKQYLFGTNNQSYVYLKKGGQTWKKKVVTGLENEEEIVIISGVEPKDKICTTIPDNEEKVAFIEG